MAYVYVGGSEWTEPMEADMMYADTADMVESGNGGVGTPPSPKDIIEEYRRKRLAKEAKEAEERETRLKAARDTPLIEPTPTPLPEPDPEPMPTPEVMAPPPRRAMKPKSTAAMSGRKGGGKTSGQVASGEDPATTTTRPRGETDAERTARYAREDAEREVRIKAGDEERAARIEEEETRRRRGRVRGWRSWRFQSRSQTGAVYLREIGNNLTRRVGEVCSPAVIKHMQTVNIGLY